MAKSRRRSKKAKSRRIPVRYWVAGGALLVVGITAIAAFNRYRVALESEEPLTERVARSEPEILTIANFRFCLPNPEEQGFSWLTAELSAKAVDPSVLGRRAVERWAAEIASAAGVSPSLRTSYVDHFFIDDRQVVYVDFAPSFVSSFQLGTSAEAELLTSLRMTVHANVPSSRGLVVMSGGITLDTWGGHLTIGETEILMLRQMLTGGG